MTSICLMRRRSGASFSGSVPLTVGAQPIMGPRSSRRAMTPARIVVTRDASDDVGDRQILLSLDSEHWTTLFYGQSAPRELPPGSHRLKADNTLFWNCLLYTSDAADERSSVDLG